MPPKAKPHLLTLARSVHGSVLTSELQALGVDLQQVIDFSVNTSPFGPPPSVREAAVTADITRYPDPEARQLRDALAEALAVPEGCVLVGNGSVELVWLIALGYLGPGDRALVMGPTFGEYEVAARIAGAEVHLFLASAAEGFVPDLEAVRSALMRFQPQVVFLCNPNNPTGVYLNPETLRPLVSAFGDVLFVIDEAYLPFLEHGASCLIGGMLDNLVVLRSMTKECAIPGLRLGYGVGSEQIVNMLRRVQPPWSVSAPAQAAGLAASGERNHFSECLHALAGAKAYLMAALADLLIGQAGLGMEVCPSTTNFFLVKVGDGAAFRQRLLLEGCCVRDCASFGLPEYVRIGVRTLPECQRLVAAVIKVLEGATVRG